LKDLARRLKLSPTTLSLVLNESPAAASIPQATKNRIFAAAETFHYRPSFLARSLRSRRTYTVGVLVPELSEGYSSLILSGIEDCLIQEGYLYLVTSHRNNPKLRSQLFRTFHDRCVEGVVAVDTPCEQALPLPAVSVSGHDRKPGVTRVVLNHETAAGLGLRHLADLGHRRIAFTSGQEFSSDARVRWDAIRNAARRMGLTTPPALALQLDGDSPSPEAGYRAARRLLASKEVFTALFAFNDVSAIGAIRAFREAGRRVPEDISVVGFDDAYNAAFHIPALTTIRQPLRRMGTLAAETLIRRIVHPEIPAEKTIQLEPALVIRESTGAVASSG